MNLDIALLDELCLRLADTLLHFLWQGAAIALAAAVAMLLTRRAAARTRYALLIALFVLTAASPIATFILLPHGPSFASVIPTVEPAVQVSSAPGHADVGVASSSAQALGGDPPVENSRMPASSAPALEAALDPFSTTSSTSAEPPAPTHPRVAPPSAQALGGGDTSTSTDSTASPGAPASRAHAFGAAAFLTRAFKTTASFTQSHAAALTLIYALGVILMLLRLAWAVCGGRRLRRACLRVDDPTLLEQLRDQARLLGMRVAPIVAYCERIAVPTVVGIFRPMVLLPLFMATGFTPAQLELILRHELAHIVRYDHIVNLIQRLVEAFLFFHPGVWYLSRLIRVEREHCCDDLVLATGGEALAYADSLVRIAERGLGKEPLDAVAMASRPSDLRRRIIRLLEGPAPHVRFTRMGLVLMLMLLIGTGAAIHAATREPKLPTPPGVPDTTAIAQLTESIESTVEPTESTVESIESTVESTESTVEPNTPPSAPPARTIRAAAVPSGPLSDVEVEIDGQTVDLGEGAYFIALMTTTCERCKDAVPALNDLAAQKFAPPIIALMAGVTEELEQFRVETEPAFPTQLIDAPTWTRLLDQAPAPPQFVLIKDGLRLASWNEVVPSAGTVAAAAETASHDPADPIDRSDPTDPIDPSTWSTPSTFTEPAATPEIEDLRQQLDSPDPWLRQVAAQQLGDLKDKGAVPKLASILLEKVYSEAQIAAAEALGKIDGPDAVRPLVAALKLEGETPAAAQRALTAIGERPETLTLLRYAANDRNNQMRQNARKVLASYGTPNALEIFIASISDSDSSAELGPELARFAPDIAVPVLLRTLTEGTLLRQATAAYALAAIDRPDVNEALAAALPQAPATVRASATRALGTRKDDGSAKLLLASLHDPVYEIRVAGAQALRERRISPSDPADLAAYQAALQNWLVLPTLGDAATEPLINALSSDDPEARQMAAYTLAATADRAAVPALIEALRDPKDDVRHTAAQALGAMRDPAAVPALIQALTDDHARYGAADSLGRIGEPAAVPALIASLKDLDGQMRSAAAQALGAIGDPQAIKPLVDSLNVDPQYLDDNYAGVVTDTLRKLAKKYSGEVMALLPEPEPEPEPSAVPPRPIPARPMRVRPNRIDPTAVLRSLSEELQTEHGPRRRPIVKGLVMDESEGRLGVVLEVQASDGGRPLVRLRKGEEYDGFRVEELDDEKGTARLRDLKTSNLLELRAGEPVEQPSETKPPESTVTIGQDGKVSMNVDKLNISLEDESARHKPEIIITGFFTGDAGQTWVSLQIWDPKSGKHENIRLGIGEEVLGYLLKEVNVQEKSALLRHKQSGDVIEVRVGDPSNVSTTPTEPAAAADQSEKPAPPAVKLQGFFKDDETGAVTAFLEVPDEEGTSTRKVQLRPGETSGNITLEELDVDEQTVILRVQENGETKLLKLGVTDPGGDSLNDRAPLYRRPTGGTPPGETEVEMAAEDALSVDALLKSLGQPLSLEITKEENGEVQAVVVTQRPGEEQQLHALKEGDTFHGWTTSEVNVDQGTVSLTDVAGRKVTIDKDGKLALQGAPGAPIRVTEVKLKPASPAQPKPASPDARAPGMPEPGTEGPPSAAVVAPVREAWAGDYQEVIDQLSDDDWWLRKVAADQLGVVGQPGRVTISNLILTLKDKDPRVQAAAAEALGKLGDPQAVKHLVAALKEDEPVRSAAAEALAKFEPGQTLDLLKLALADEKNEEVRVGAVKALRYMPPDLALPLLTEQLKKIEPFALVVKGEQLTPHREASPLQTELWQAFAEAPYERAMPLLAQVAREGALGPAAIAVDLLSTWDTSAAHQTLIDLAQSPDAPARAKAIGWLDQVPGQDVVDLLVSLLDDPSWEIRQAAAHSLEARNFFPETPEARARYYVLLEKWDAVRSVGKAAVEPLMAALKAPVPVPSLEQRRRTGMGFPSIPNPSTVPAYAASLLVELGITDAVDEIADLLQRENPALRAYATVALGELGDPRATPALIEATRDAEANVRYNALGALRRLNTPESVEAVIAALQDPESENRRLAASALGEMKAETVVEPLSRALNDVDSRVQTAAMGALASIGGPAAVEAVASLLASERHEGWREIAATTLGQMGSAAAPYLIQALTDESEQVWNAAMMALGEIGDPAAIEAIAAFLSPERVYKDEEQANRVQGYAIRALAKLGPNSIPHLEKVFSNPNLSNSAREDVERAIQQLREQEKN